MNGEESNQRIHPIEDGGPPSEPARERPDTAGMGVHPGARDHTWDYTVMHEKLRKLLTDQDLARSDDLTKRAEARRHG